MSELELAKQTINAEPVKAIGGLESRVCSICGQIIIGYEGCDPAPIVEGNSICCYSDCYKRYVIPAKRKAKKARRHSQ